MTEATAVTTAEPKPPAQGAGASEATLIEQTRAVAQVQGALVVAQQRPRDEIAARNRMEQACQQPTLAERAFFRFPRGGSQISGPSIHLATELARCWGNLDYGIAELRRDAVKRESEMMAYAWDLETNQRNSSMFIVPHKRDQRGGPVALVDIRDVYENNANAAARRVRECIFRVLPTSFVEVAKEICATTLREGGGVPIEERRATLLESFNDLGVSRKRIEAKMGRAADRLTAFDIGTLRVIYQSIRRGEATVAQEFPGSNTPEASAAALRDQARAGGEPAPAPDKAVPAPALSEQSITIARDIASMGSDRLAHHFANMPPEQVEMFQSVKPELDEIAAKADG